LIFDISFSPIILLTFVLHWRWDFLSQFIHKDLELSWNFPSIVIVTDDRNSLSATNAATATNTEDEQEHNTTSLELLEGADSSKVNIDIVDADKNANANVNAERDMYSNICILYYNLFLVLFLLLFDLFFLPLGILLYLTRIRYPVVSNTYHNINVINKLTKGWQMIPWRSFCLYWDTFMAGM
jgi:hypothetical protein